MKEVNLRMGVAYHIPFQSKFQLSQVYRKLTLQEIAGIEVLIEEIVREQIYD